MKITLLCMLLALEAGSATAQTVIPLVNPGFETKTAGMVFAVKISAGWDESGNDVAGWINAGSGNNYCGVDYQGDNGITVHSGSVCGWTQGGKPGAYQITGYQMQSGQQLNLTWWAKSTYSPSGNGIQLVASPLPKPNIGLQLVGGNSLALSWPAKYWGWNLMAQTGTLSGGLGANWYPVAGSSQTNQVLQTINPANGAVFFRLVSP